MAEQVLSQSANPDNEIMALPIAQCQRTRIVRHPFSERIELALIDPGWSDQPGGSGFGLDVVTRKQPNFVESEKDTIVRGGLKQQPCGQEQTFSKRPRLGCQGAQLFAFL